MAEDVPRLPNIWTDGSRDEDLDELVGISGVGAFVETVPGYLMGAHKISISMRMFAGFLCLFSRGCRRLSELNILELSFPLQANMPVHLGNDNKNVSKYVGRLLDGLVHLFGFAPMVICSLVFPGCVSIGCALGLRLVRLEVMPLMPWWLMGEFGGETRRVMMLLILPQILAGFGNHTDRQTPSETVRPHVSYD